MNSGFKCLECGKKFKTARAAERAASVGCPKCGGVDIDIDVSPEVKKVAEQIGKQFRTENGFGH